jgi:hypothetical protein
MPAVVCAHCDGSFDFDPKQIWTSPGPITQKKSGGAQKVVIQCPQCQKWLTVELKDGKSDGQLSKTDS